MKKSKSLFKASGVLFFVSLLTLLNGPHQALASENQLMSRLKEETKTDVKLSSIRETLKNAPTEEWLDYGVVAGGNTHVYGRGIGDPMTHYKLRIGNPNATGQTINGARLREWLKEMSPTPEDKEFLQEIHTAGATPIKVRGDLWGTFYTFFGLKTIDLSKFDTSEVTYMTQLFSNNSNLTNLDISNFDTRNVISMQHMFNGASSLKELDLRHFDTRKVKNVHRMFANMSNLERLDISNFDNQSLQGVDYMFQGANALKILSLGHSFNFTPYPDGLANADLPPVPTNNLYSGKWQDVGTGTVSQPEGSNILTSEELMEQYDGETMAGTYVWQPVIQ